MRKLLIIGLPILGLVAVGASKTPDKSPAGQLIAPAVSNNIPSEGVLISRAQRGVRGMLRDPDSARFRNVRLSQKIADIPDPVVCGEVNAKNGFGGYTGYGRFFSVGTKGFSVLEFGETPREGFIKLWNARCD
jgi:hypothetical protein